jgi:hypothetical protein
MREVTAAGVHPSGLAVPEPSAVDLHFLAVQTFEGKGGRLLDWPQSPQVGVLCAYRLRRNVFLPHLAINSRHELYLAVADARTPRPGVRIFDTDRELTTTPLNVGQLLPSWILCIE